MISKSLNDKIQASRQEELLPYLKNLLTLIPRDRDEEVVALVAAMIKVSDNHALTKAHLTWTQVMMDYSEKYPQHGDVVQDIFRFVSDSATVDLAIGGASQEDIDRWETNVKRLMSVD